MMDHMQRWDDGTADSPAATGDDNAHESQLSRVADEAAVQALFRLVDRNSDGTVSTEELQVS